MGKRIKIKINNKVINCKEGDWLGKLAEQNGIEIPKLCFHKDFPIKGNCRVCVVEVKGMKKLLPSCSTRVWNGMEVLTQSKRVKKARAMNIELIFAEHIEKCPTCIWRSNCPLLAMAYKYGLKINRFHDRKSKRKIWKFKNAVEIDGTQCIDCGNCIDACSLQQKINYLKFEGKGRGREVVTREKEGAKCILCGQCALHCPVSAAQEQAHWSEVQKDLEKKNRKQILVAQFAPSINVSIGEEFGLGDGKVVTGKVISALRELGFNYVFDVNFGADITTVVQAKELLKRIGKKNSKMPMFTSCCPGWINYVELYHPELIPHLTTACSPHINSGGVIKTYWANGTMTKPKNIKVVSIMPCTAQKQEAKRGEMKINGNFPVDQVLTTREFAWLIRRAKIDFTKLKSGKADTPLGEYSGSALIHDSSGGMMESVLRTAQALSCKNKKSGNCRSKIDFKKVRGMNGVKEATVKIGRKKLRIAVVNGIGNIDSVINNIKRYDYVEVMACRGGCIGGGGQPIPTNDIIREKRMKSLYDLDKKQKVREALRNKSAMEALDWIEEKKGLKRKVLHTKYKKTR